MNISSSEITIRVDIDFEEADVDMVYKEAIAAGVQTAVPSVLTNGAKIKVNEEKLPMTPIGGTIDFALNWLAGFVDRDEMCIDRSHYGGTRGDNATTPFQEHSQYFRQTELEAIGFEVESWYGLMMGTCHITLKCSYDEFSQERLSKAQEIISGVFKKFVKYYKS